MKFIHKIIHDYACEERIVYEQINKHKKYMYIENRHEKRYINRTDTCIYVHKIRGVNSM